VEIGRGVVHPARAWLLELSDSVRPEIQRQTSHFNRIRLKDTQAFEFKSSSFSPTHVDYLSKVTVEIASVFSYFLREALQGRLRPFVSR
jgi:hypothetical protein